MDEFLMRPKVDFAFKEIMMNEKARIGFLSTMLNLNPDNSKRFKKRRMELIPSSWYTFHTLIFLHIFFFFVSSELPLGVGLTMANTYLISLVLPDRHTLIQEVLSEDNLNIHIYLNRWLLHFLLSCKVRHW